MAREKKRVPLAEAGMPISAMIDIVFLLIMFFVATAAMDKEIEDEQISLTTAPHGKPIQKKDPRSVVINVRKNGKMNISGQEMSNAQVSAILTSAAARWGNDTPIVIRGDRRVQHHYIEEAMNTVTEVQLYRVKFNAMVEEDKPKE